MHARPRRQVRYHRLAPDRGGARLRSGLPSSPQALRNSLGAADEGQRFARRPHEAVAFPRP